MFQKGKTFQELIFIFLKKNRCWHLEPDQRPTFDGVRAQLNAWVESLVEEEAEMRTEQTTMGSTTSDEKTNTNSPPRYQRLESRQGTTQKDADEPAADKDTYSRSPSHQELDTDYAKPVKRDAEPEVDTVSSVKTTVVFNF